MTIDTARPLVQEFLDKGLLKFQEPLSKSLTYYDLAILALAVSSDKSDLNKATTARAIFKSAHDTETPEEVAEIVAKHL